MTEDNAFVDLKTLREDEDLDKYNSDLEEDLRTTKSNIMEKSLLVSSLRCKWLNYYFFEVENLSRLTKLKEMYTKKKISGSKIEDPLIRMKANVSMEENDVELKKINNAMKKVKNRIDFLERVQNIMNNLPLTIKNSIEIMKMEMR